MFKLGLEKPEELEIKLPNNICWIIDKARHFQKTSPSISLSTLKPLTVWITTNWKILKEMGRPDHLTCLLRNLSTGQEATVRTGHRTTDWFNIGKGVCQGCILSPWLFNLHAEYIMWNAGLDETQTGIKIAGRKMRHADDPTLAPSQVVLVIKNLPANAGDLTDADSILGSRRASGEGHGNPFQYSCLC